MISRSFATPVARSLRVTELILPGGMFLIILALFGIIFVVSKRHETRVLRLKTEQNCQQVALRLQTYVEVRLSQLEQLRHVWSDGHLETPADFAAHAHGIQASLGAIQAINWIDADGVIRWIVPEAGNEKARGQRLLDKPVSAPSLRWAIAERSLAMTPPIELYQGGVGLAGYLPLGDPEAGVLNIVFRTKPLIEGCLADGVRPGYYFAVLDGPDQLYAYWPEGGPVDGAPVVQRDIGVANRTWTVRLTPNETTIGLARTSVDNWMLLAAGMLACILAGFLARLLVIRRALEEHRARLGAAAEHVPGVLYTYESTRSGERRLIYLGPGLEELLGPRAAAEVTRRFDRLFELIHPDDREFVTTLAATLGSGETLDHEIRMRTDDGTYRWVRSLARPSADPADERRWHVLLIDIDEQKAAAERQQLLLRELDHRVKNNLAAVQSLCDQTLETTGSREEFHRAFTGRIAALSRTHELISNSSRTPLELGRLVRETLTPFIEHQDDRIVIEGPPTPLSPRRASALALVLHELATNAVKHGALRRPDGTLRIRWDAAGDRLEQIVWTETASCAGLGGIEGGLGTRLIRGLVERELGGVAAIVIAPDGLRCVIDLSADPSRGAEPEPAAAAGI